MVALDSGFTALAAFQAGDWFAFAVQLLHLPTVAARLLCGHRGVLSPIVGYDPVRAVGRHRYSEQMHLMVFGKPLDLDALALRQLGRVPDQRVDPLVRLLTAGIIHLAVILKGTVVVAD